jgi:hypothetical protein
VDKNYRRKGLASQIFTALLKLNQAQIIKIINVDKAHPEMENFLKSFGIGISGSQYEMVKGV